MQGIEKFKYYMQLYLDDVAHSNKSEQTVRNYGKAFKQFIEYWNEYGELENDPRTPLFRAWRNAMDAKGLKPSTVKNYLMALHIFFSYYADEESDAGELVYGGRNPVSKKLYPKQENKQYDVILSDEQVSLLWANERPTSKQAHHWARNYCICVLLLDSKIRNAECLDLRLSDVFLNEGFLIVRHGKGGKQREVTLSPISVSAIRLYLASGLRPSSLSDDDYLFGTTADATGLYGQTEWHRGTSQWLSSLIERHVFSVTGVHNVRTHDLRHIGARLNLNTGVTLEALESELGHSSFAVTQIYTGKLQTRQSKRDGARNAMRIRDEWAARNMEMLNGIS